MSKIYTVEQISGHLGLHPKTIRRYIREGQIAATKIGKQYRITSDELERFLGIDVGKPDSSIPQAGANSPKSTTIELAISVSSSIDIRGVDGTLASTLTRNIMSASYGSQQARVDCIYYESSMEFKVLTHGSIDYTEQMLKHVNLLISRIHNNQS